MRRLVLCLTAFALVVPFFGSPRAAAGPITLGIVNADTGLTPDAQLLATGRFSSVTDIDARFSTPTLAQLTPYKAILAYTNYSPADGTALGNVLKQYVDGGGHLVMATFAYSAAWAIKGGITNPGYAPLNVGIQGDVSGILSPVIPSDPVFNGVNLAALTYFHNGYFSHPGLDAGATLIATDGAGSNMIARNSAGNVVGVNLYPGTYGSGNNDQFYLLLANALNPSFQPTSAPEPASITLLGLGALGMAGYGWRRRRLAV